MIYGFSAIPIKIPTKHFVDIRKLIIEILINDVYQEYINSTYDSIIKKTPNKNWQKLEQTFHKRRYQNGNVQMATLLAISIIRKMQINIELRNFQFLLRI